MKQLLLAEPPSVSIEHYVPCAEVSQSFQISSVSVIKELRE